MKHPMSVYFDITNKCNKKCYVCPVRERDFALGEMSANLFKKVVNALPKGTELDLHQSGEPLLHKELWYLLRHAKLQGRYVRFTTNGLLLDERKKELVNLVDEITISLMDTTAIESVKNFLKYKGGRKPKVFIKGFLKKGAVVEGKNLTPDVVEGGKDVCLAWIELLALGCHQKIGQIHDLDNPTKRKAKTPCPKLISAPVITWDGLVLLCCRDFHRKTVTGDLRKESLVQILPRHEAIYKEQEKGIFTGLCDGCNHIERESEVWGLVAKNKKKPKEVKKEEPKPVAPKKKVVKKKPKKEPVVIKKRPKKKAEPKKVTKKVAKRKPKKRV